MTHTTTSPLSDWGDYHWEGKPSVSKLYDFTQLDALARCEAEHGYRYQQHLARAEPDASAFFGQIVHVGVRNLFAGTHESDGLAQAWGEFVAPPKKAHLTLRYAQEIVEMYAAQHFPSKQFELVLNEHYLEYPERSLCGIVDRVVRSKADGQLYVMDLKTTGLYLSQAWFEQWRHSLQAAIYLDLVEHALCGAANYRIPQSAGDPQSGGYIPGPVRSNPPIQELYDAAT